MRATSLKLADISLPSGHMESQHQDYIMPVPLSYFWSFDPLRRQSPHFLSSPLAGHDFRKPWLTTSFNFTIRRGETVEEGEGVHELQVCFILYFCLYYC